MSNIITDIAIVELVTKLEESLILIKQMDITNDNIISLSALLMASSQRLDELRRLREERP